MSQPTVQLYGLLGYPIKHSLSPCMHNAAFSSLGIPARYELFETKPEELEAFLNGLTGQNIGGLNVTIPYKEKVIPFCAGLSEEARLIGAVNTVKISDGLLQGFNTDGAGFLRHLMQDIGFDPRGKNIALAGAGGAARAISVYLGKASVLRLGIYDIDAARASALVAYMRTIMPSVNVELAGSIADLRIEDCDLLINATPVGMKEGDPLLIEKNLLRKGLLVYDIIYTPARTRLLKTAQEAGATVSNGLGMLLYQGMNAFEIWTGKKAPKEVMQRALLEELERRTMRE